MNLVIKRRSLKALLGLLIYKSLLDYAYIALLSEHYSYTGIVNNTNAVKIAVSYIILIGLWLLTPTGRYKIFDIFVNIQLLLMLIPMLTVYGTTNRSTEYLFMVLLCYAVQCFFCMMHKEHASVSVNKTNTDFNSFLLLMTALVVGMCILRYGIPSLTALNITRVYEVRDENILAFPLSYLVPWCAKIIIPFGFVLSLEEKKYNKAFLYLILQLILYLSFAHKTYLFMILLAGGVWFVCKKEWLYQILYMVFPLGVAGSILIYKILGNLLVLSYFTRRVLIVPASLKFTYFEFYSVHPKVYFYNSIIGKVLGLESTYTESAPERIGKYLGSPGVMANTGYLGEAYAEGGYFVLIIMSLILLMICKMCALKKNINMNIFLTMFILWIYTLNDVAVQTSLMTGGGAILLLLYAIWPERQTSLNNSSFSGSKTNSKRLKLVRVKK
jgi:hypothetical protein